jgi:hypothetical protein
LSVSLTHLQDHGPEPLAERIRLAHQLAESDPIDVSAALALLNTMPETLGAEFRNAVDHTRRAVAAAPGGDHRQGAVARYMLARLAIMMDRTVRCGA